MDTPGTLTALDKAIVHALSQHGALNKRDLILWLRQAEPNVWTELSPSEVNSRLYALERLGHVSKDTSTLPNWRLGTEAPLPPPVPAAAAPAPATRVELGASVPMPGLHTATPIWTAEQREVIEAPASARLLVEAAPGTGKTAVACARAGYLIAHGSPASSIHIVSFTRTAVAELRQRIASAVGSEHLARDVRISTLDSTAWQLLYGFTQSEAKRLLGDFERNIDEVLELLESDHNPLLDHLESIQQLIVDEAQDLTLGRGRLVAAIVRHLPGTCGVSIFYDPAQAIYGFTADDDNEAREAFDLIPALAHPPGRTFQRVALTTVHRTQDTTLLALHNTLRPLVIQNASGAGSKLLAVKRHLANGAHRSLSCAPWPLDCDLVLYRRRIDALVASSHFSKDGVLHRLRLSGLPTIVHPWIAVALHDADPAVGIDEPRFLDLWSTRAASWPHWFQGLEPKPCFATLLECTGSSGSILRVSRLCDVLARARPPLYLCVPDLGAVGPILGTIHASKGREADRVVLDLRMGEPLGNENRSREEHRLREDEESRVMYVAATRARSNLAVIASDEAPTAAMTLLSGRAYRFTSKYAQFEIGRDRDVDLRAQVTSALGDSTAVQRAQSFLAAYDGKPVPLIANSTSGRYILQADAVPVGCLTRRVADDMRDIRRHRYPETPSSDRLQSSIRHIYLVGVTTVGVADSAWAGEAIPPWAQSGIFLAPVIKGFTILLPPRR